MAARGAPGFSTPPGAYERYMGVWSRRLAPVFADAVGVAAGLRALDVGCGTGALTVELAARLGPGAVAAVDPSEPFAAACAAGAPGVDVRVAPAEELPFADGAFDVVLSQLVLNFLADAPRAVAGMRRVARPGGTVAACTWDYRGEMTMLRAFWQAAADVDPGAPAEGAVMRYCTPAELEELWRGAGLEAVRTDALHVERAYDAFEEVWEPFTNGVGPAGLFVRALDDDRRGALRDGFRRRLGDPNGPFTLTARAWFVAGERAG